MYILCWAAGGFVEIDIVSAGCDIGDNVLLFLIFTNAETGMF